MLLSDMLSLTLQTCIQQGPQTCQAQSHQPVKPVGRTGHLCMVRLKSCEKGCFDVLDSEAFCVLLLDWRILLCCINEIGTVLLTAKALKIVLMKDHHQSWCNTQWIQSISGQVKSQMRLSQRIYDKTALLLYFKSAAQRVNQENHENLLLVLTTWPVYVLNVQCNYFSGISKNTD